MTMQLTYSNSVLPGTGLKGELACHPDGYFRDVVLGGFGTHNRSGQLYDFDSAARFFEMQSEFMNMVKSGHLRGECGHPKRQPGMKDKEWLARVCAIEETLISHHIREVKLVDGLVTDPKTGAKCPGVLAELKPCGPYGESLESSLKNPHENVCFSIRSLTADRIMPTQWIKFMRRLITWDQVYLAGIPSANKYESPSLESAVNTHFSNRSVEEYIHDAESGRISLENSSVVPESFRNEMYDARFGGSILDRVNGTSPRHMAW